MNNKEVNFTKSIIKYYMEFLESDFHKKKAPKRKIEKNNSSNLLVGCDLRRYDNFEQKMIQAISGKFKSGNLSIKKGSYTVVPNEKLLASLVDKMGVISNKNIKYLNKTFLISVSENLKKENMSDTVLLDNATNELNNLLSSLIIKPYIDDNMNLFAQLGIQEQGVETLHDELLNMIILYFKDMITASINTFRNNGKKDIKTLINYINVENLKNVTKDYFAEYNVADLYLELSNMEKSKKLLDKQEMYFSFFDIAYNGVKYPIFFIPVELIENNEGNRFVINFDSQLYVNKKSLEFIAQELKEKLNLIGKIDAVDERIIYLEEVEDLTYYIEYTLNKICDYFKFDDEFDLNDRTKKIIKNDLVSFSNSFYFNVFDKSDDALVNDYEELLQLLEDDDSELSNEINEIIKGFMVEEPYNINSEIEDEWEGNSLEEKLVIEAPIPLNSEQIQILQALKNDKCKYVSVQGPPGTGKSHTITAIVFDMILNDKSVLVLSDKKEALDVVEDKITSTLNKVRSENNFQNPVLRLGKTGNNYANILSQASIDSIKNHFKATKQQSENVEQDINRYVNTIKEEIDFEKISYEKIKIEDILQYEELESIAEDLNKKFSIDELTENITSIDKFLEIYTTIVALKSEKNYEAFEKFSKLIGDYGKINYSKEDVLELYNKSSILIQYTKLLMMAHQNILDIFSIYNDMNEEKLEMVKNIYTEYSEQPLRSIVFLINRNKRREIISKIERIFPKSADEDFDVKIKNIAFLISLCEKVKANLNKHFFQPIEIFEKLIFSIEEYQDLSSMKEIIEQLNTINNNSLLFKNNFMKLNFENIKNIDGEYDDRCEQDYYNVAQYIELKDSLVRAFSGLSISKYVSEKTKMEELVTLKVTNKLDGRVIDFFENNQSTAKLLRGIIQKKQKFPKERFDKLKHAFPCILAGIRDYAEYIPLESNMFDLVIIDEASQVSIAQALPALLRAKKVLVLGDKKQFSNVKSSQARTDINAEYMSAIKSSHKNTSFYNSGNNIKLDKFNIKSSILEFFEFISNYSTMLYKYFRGYKEIISYSNKNFYDNKLQVMKIRGKDINEVIKFEYIDHDGKIESTPKTNKLEVEYIVKELIRINESSENVSVGIITPHTNQQKLISSEIEKLVEKSSIYSKLNLKVMTFDTCQGEERDIIYYSMVANPGADTLWAVFLKDFNTIDQEEEGNIRAQRLNVGFSRAKECMHFVISKPLEDFTGEIGNALRHYKNEIDRAKKEKSVDTVDQKSAMEPLVLEWFYSTEFWKNNSDYIEFIPQFELGKYLKQMDNNYTHPLYCVDFLLLYKQQKEIKIIIEYDGFKEHFNELTRVSLNNYNDYYKEDDIYRQKVLESYGYKFLRINKFNVGNNPVEELDKRLRELLNDSHETLDTFDAIRRTERDLRIGRQKECPKCGKILDVSAFEDNNLLTGYGKICKECKSKKNHSNYSSNYRYRPYRGRNRWR